MGRELVQQLCKQTSRLFPQRERRSVAIERASPARREEALRFLCPHASRRQQENRNAIRHDQEGIRARAAPEPAARDGADPGRGGFRQAVHRGVQLLRATSFPATCTSRTFGKVVKDAVRAAGGVPFEFNTIGVDDGIAMGHDGHEVLAPVARADRRLRGDDGRRRTASTR